MLILMASKASSVAQFFTVLILFLIICGLTYYTTRFIASYQKGNLKASNIETIDSYRLDNSKYISIVRIGNKILALCVCKDTVTVLCELSEDELIQTTFDSEMAKFPFQKILDKVKEKTKTEKQDEDDEKNDVL